MVRGNLTLLQATAVTDRWGATHYGALSGLLAAVATVAAAIAPWAGANLAHTLGGYSHLFVAFCVASLAAAILAALASAGTARAHVPHPRSPRQRGSHSRTKRLQP
ncbi:hypothetical protein [Streptomyces sp. WAC01526]|uniref:hypothetical protein n=1 Tax=Streptomyces sp. WAC01526 TaxID=2588709 RepID=UPI0037DBF886